MVPQSCYYDTEQGETSWFAPDGSSPSFMHDQADFSDAVLMQNLPPSLPAQATVGSPTKTGWFVLFVDATDGVLLYHGRTGHVRLAPWICLRDEFGCVYFGNLMTGVTHSGCERTSPGRPCTTSTCRTRQRVDDLQSIALCLASAQAPSSKLTRLVNRTMVEGGAPY